jgi:peroxiredoxin
MRRFVPPTTWTFTLLLATGLVALHVATLASQVVGQDVAKPPRAATDKPRAARTITIEEALKELDLIRPGRSQPARDFTAASTGGATFRLADHRGKVVLINFWATWCPPCLEEMPALERLWQRQKGGGFVLVAVSLDSNTSLVRPFVTERGLTFPVALDPRLEVANAYGVRALPTTVLIDRQGTVRALALGPRVWDNDAAHGLVEGLTR